MPTTGIYFWLCNEERSRSLEMYWSLCCWCWIHCGKFHSKFIHKFRFHSNPGNKENSIAPFSAKTAKKAELLRVWVGRVNVSFSLCPSYPDYWSVSGKECAHSLWWLMTHGWRMMAMASAIMKNTFNNIHRFCNVCVAKKTLRPQWSHFGSWILIFFAV